MKLQPPYQINRLKKLNLASGMSGRYLQLQTLYFPHPALQASSKVPTTTSKPGSTVSKPVKQSGVKSSKSTSKSKKIASRSKKRRKPPVRGQRTIESARVVEIQNALAAAGYYKTRPNGEWDDSTSKAMSTYQQDNGFRTTGKPDAFLEEARTLAKSRLQIARFISHFPSLSQFRKGCLDAYVPSSSPGFRLRAGMTGSQEQVCENHCRPLVWPVGHDEV